MDYSGFLQKMQAHAANEVQYYLNLGKDVLHMNDLIGKDIKLIYQHKITCFCGKEVSSVFRQNFCSGRA